MDDQNKNLENDYEIEIETSDTEDYKLSIQEQIYEIEIKMQEIDVLIEQYEDALYNSEEEIFSVEKLTELKTEYKSLRKEKKLLSKQLKSKWDQIPIWIFLYGVFQIIFTSFVVIVPVSMHFMGWFLDITSLNSEFWVTTAFLIIPILNIFLSVVMFLLIKNTARRRFLAVIFAIQFIETIIAIIIMFT